MSTLTPTNTVLLCHTKVEAPAPRPRPRPRGRFPSAKPRPRPAVAGLSATFSAIEGEGEGVVACESGWAAATDCLGEIMLFTGDCVGGCVLVADLAPKEASKELAAAKASLAIDDEASGDGLGSLASSSCGGARRLLGDPGWDEEGPNKLTKQHNWTMGLTGVTEEEAVVVKAGLGGLASVVGFGGFTIAPLPRPPAFSPARTPRPRPRTTPLPLPRH